MFIDNTEGSKISIHVCFVTFLWQCSWSSHVKQLHKLNHFLAREFSNLIGNGCVLGWNPIHLLLKSVLSRFLYHRLVANKLSWLFLNMISEHFLLVSYCLNRTYRTQILEEPHYKFTFIKQRVIVIVEIGICLTLTMTCYT